MEIGMHLKSASGKQLMSHFMSFEKMEKQDFETVVFQLCP